MERDHRNWQLTGSRTTAWTVGLLVTWSCLCVMLPSEHVRAAEAEAENEPRTVSDTGASLTGRAGYLAFGTFGRDDSITHAELMPYFEVDQHTLFGDARLFMSNDGYFGGNVGVGYRYRLPEGNRFLGASFWYDIDDTTSEMYHQLGVSLESCGSFWDVRSNLYLPIGDYEKDYGITVQDQRFAGNQIVYTGARSFGAAMKGFDLELGLPLPTELARKHNLSITPGTYMFFGDAAPDIYGYKLRAEGSITSNVAMQVEMTEDDTFGTTVMLGIEFVLPGGSRHQDPSDTSSRIRTDQFVHRNYNVIVSKQADLQPGLTAINPATGLPYTIQHVSTTAGGANLGTVEDPFSSVADAQAAGGDILFVHGGSVLSAPIVMQAGEQILGEGVGYSIDYGSFGIGLLPTVNAGSAQPTLLGVSGAAVTLASDSWLAGFVVDSPTGYGVVGNAVDNVTIHDMDVRNTGLDGLYLRDLGGENSFYNLAITGAGAAGIAIEGAGDYVIDDAHVEDSAGAGVEVLNATGTYALENLVVTNQSGGPALSIVDSTAVGTLDNLNLATDGATGLFVQNGGEIEIESGQIDAVNGTAVDIENATVNANLTSVSSSGAAVGLRIVDHEGEFLILGDGETLGSGGLIQNATTGVVLVNAETVGLRCLDLDGNGVGIDASNSEELSLSNLQVTNSTNYGLDALNMEIVTIAGSVFEDNGASTDNSIRFRADTLGDYGLFVSGTTVTDATAAAIAMSTVGSGAGSSLTLQIYDNDIDLSRYGAAGVEIDWDGPIVGSILYNGFESTADLTTAVNVVSTSTSELAELAVVQNLFEFEGDDSVGMRFETAGPATLSAGQNSVVFDGSGGTGLEFLVAPSADIYVYNNTITDNVSGGTGILFTSIAGPSTVTLQANTIDLLSDTAVIDRGIIFTTVTDTVELLSPTNNVVTGATTSFYAPVGSLTGHAYVNGETVP